MNTKFLVLALLCLTVTLTAQTKFGVKAFSAVSYTAEQSKEFISLNPQSRMDIAFVQASPRKGIGLSFHTQNDKLFLTTDASYMTAEKTYALQSTGLMRRTVLDPAVIYTNNSTAIRTAVTAGVVLNGLKLGVGPELSWNLSEEENLSELDHLSYESRPYSSGFNFLVGYILSDMIHVDLKHTYIFQDVSDGYRHDSVPMDLRKNLKYVELSIGIFLL